MIIMFYHQNLMHINERHIVPNELLSVREEKLSRMISVTRYT